LVANYQKMLSLPIYLRASNFYLHTRINGHQVKRSLHTSDKVVAIIRASELLRSLHMIDDRKIRTYNLNIHQGTAQADGPEDHERLMQALNLMKEVQLAMNGAQPTQPQQIVSQPVVVPTVARRDGLRLSDLVDKYFLIRKQSTQATVRAYKTIAKEFASFLKNPIIDEIGQADVTRWQEKLAEKSSVRTIDNKIGCIRALFNFAIKQGYYFDKNPAQDRQILSKKEKINGGWAIMEMDEVKVAFSSEKLGAHREDDPDFYWVLMISLFTGCRVGEITSLLKNQISVTDAGTHYLKIRDAKTFAGIRQVPIPSKLWESGLKDFVDGKEDNIFRYVDREGKGSGNAVGKKFSRYLESLKLNREKLVFHSIRKFFNDFMRDERIPFEVRCQLLGHEIENVNITHYSDKFSVDHLAQDLGGVWLKLLVITGIIQTKF
jgi:integrase